MKAIFQTSQFKKDFKRIKKRGKDLSQLKEVVSTISNSEALEERHRDHALSGKLVRVKRLSYRTGLDSNLSS